MFTVSLLAYAVVVGPLWFAAWMMQVSRSGWIAGTLVPTVYAPFLIVVWGFVIAWTTGHRLAPVLAVFSIAPFRVLALMLTQWNMKLSIALLVQAPIATFELVGVMVAVAVASSPLARIERFDLGSLLRLVAVTVLVAFGVLVLLVGGHLGALAVDEFRLFRGLPLREEWVVGIASLAFVGLLGLPIASGAAVVRRGGLVPAWTGAVCGAAVYGVLAALVYTRRPGMFVPTLLLSMLPAVMMGVFLALPAGLIGAALRWLAQLALEEDAPLGLDGSGERDADTRL